MAVARRKGHAGGESDRTSMKMVERGREKREDGWDSDVLKIDSLFSCFVDPLTKAA